MKIYPKKHENSEKPHGMILVSYFEKPKPKMSKTEIIEHHGFGFGISQLLNQTDRFSPLIKNEGTNIQVNTFSSEENSDKI